MAFHKLDNTVGLFYSPLPAGFQNDRSITCATGFLLMVRGLAGDIHNVVRFLHRA